MSISSDLAALFPDLPEQREPETVWTDEHELARCEKCRGEGRLRYSFYGGGYQAERGSDTCRACNGAGRVIRYIGPATT